jgi:hypothetical protein
MAPKNLHKVVANLAASQHAFHKSMAEDPDNAEEHHKTSMAECEKAMEACAKAEVADTLEKPAHDQIVPSSISGIAPENPALRSVPRTGAPGPASGLLSPLFAKILQSPDEEENFDHNPRLQGSR